MRVYFDFSDAGPDLAGAEVANVMAAERLAIDALLGVARELAWDDANRLQVSLRVDQGATLARIGLTVSLDRGSQ